MSKLLLELKTETGSVRQATATIVHFSASQRFGKAALFLVGGVGLGAALIVVPILHLITTWALPLAGTIGCVNTLRTRSRLRDIDGVCPACENTLQHKGGRAVFPMRIDCPDCRRPLSIEPMGGENGQG